MSIPGMRFPREVEENVQLATAYEAMTGAARARIRRQAKSFLADAARV